MAAFVQDRFTQPRLVVETERGHDRPMRIHRADQPLALERHPDRGIAKPAGVARRYDSVTEVEMIAVRIGRAHDNASVFRRPHIFGKPRELLQQGQSLELQGVETERVFLGRHRG